MGDTDAPQIFELLDKIVAYEFEETADAIRYHSESALNEHLTFIEELAEVTGWDCTSSQQAIADRLSEFEETVHDDYEPSFTNKKSNPFDDFTDNDLKSLIGSLVKT